MFRRSAGKVAATVGARVECAGVDAYSARARPDTVPPSEHPAMATDTGELLFMLFFAENHNFWQNLALSNLKLR